MDTDNRVAPPIPFVYGFELQNLRRHMCCRAIKTKLIGVASNTHQRPQAIFTVSTTLGRVVIYNERTFFDWSQLLQPYLESVQ